MSGSDERGGIFEGVKLLELGAGAAGPIATRYFADQGATVIRVESSKRPDFLRTLHLTEDNPFGLDGAPMFVLMNPNKKSIAIDLSRPEGIELVKRLIAWADVVSENFSPKAMAKWGLDYPSLRSIRPDLIMLSSCLFGQTGPQRMYPGFGGQGSALAGFNHLTGWADREAVGPHGTITDSLSPRYVALLIAAALLYRKRTGEGQYIDVSQVEAGVYSLSEMIVRCSTGSDVMERRGNRDENAAPHAVFPCRGEDRWIAIAVHAVSEWNRLVRVLGDPQIGNDPRFSTTSARFENQDALETRIAESTKSRDAFELMAALQEAGIEAGVVQRADDVNRDPQLEHRGHFQTLRHVHLGELRFEHYGIRFTENPRRIRTPGPNLGEHTQEILRDELGLREPEIAALVESGILV